MSWFSRSRCHMCGQYSGSWHRCPAKRPALPTSGPTLPRPQDARTQMWDHIAEAAAAFEASKVPALTVWDHRPGRRGSRLAVPRPTRLDEATRAIFDHGHCHSLALAFAEQRYAVAGIVSVHTEKAFVPHKTSHYFAIDPKDPTFGWDSRGRRPISEIQADYRMSRVFEVKQPRRAMNVAIDEGIYLPVDLEAGRLVRHWILEESSDN